MPAASPFPYSYIGTFFEALARSPKFNLLTYHDLPWQKDDDYKAYYPKEYAEWTRFVSAEGQKKRIHLLIQHDTDSGPEESASFVRHQMSIGVRSSVMTFVRWTNPLAVGPLTDYPIDFDLLAHASAKGFAIGYHCNAYHNAKWNPDKVYDIFNEDADILASKLDLRVFSAHGGSAGPDGRINRDFDYPAHASRKLNWVHNGCSPKFKNTFSDGALMRRLKDGDATLDLRRWLGSLVPGNRYRILIHPQYYNDAAFTDTGTAAASGEWFEAWLQAWRKGELSQFWDDAING